MFKNEYKNISFNIKYLIGGLIQQILCYVPCLVSMLTLLIGLILLYIVWNFLTLMSMICCISKTNIWNWKKKDKQNLIKTI